MKYQTTAIHGGIKDDSGKRAVNYPVFLSSTFEQPDTEHFGEFAYSRGANPTRAAAEALAADLEGARYAIATASGMAATSCVFELLEKGDKVLLSNNVYGGTWRFVSNLFKNRGILYETVDDFNTLDFEQIDDTVAMVFIETPSNPLLQITDLKRVAEAVRGRNILLVVDNTFSTSYFQKPLELGADIVLYSATKYYAGHSDILAGLILLNDQARYEKLKFIQNTLGGILQPVDAFLLIRGIRTLGLRMERHQQNALAIASFLEKSPAAEKVYYPGLASHPGHEIQRRQAKGDGGVLSLLFNETEYDMNTFVTHLKYFGFAVSLGGVESLICRPMTMTHESYAKELQEKIGIKPNLLRIAAGIEDTEDLLEDIGQAIRISKKD